MITTTALSIEEIIQAEALTQRQAEQETTFEGFIVADLRAEFERITASAKNWKTAFAVPDLRAGEVRLVVAAIRYFTGDPAPRVSANLAAERYTVRTVGYYAATGEGA